MSVAFVAAVPASGTNGASGARTITFAVDCTGGNFLAVGISFGLAALGDASLETITTCTYNGVAMTASVPKTIEQDVGMHDFAALYTLANPATGSNNVVVTISGTTTANDRLTVNAAVYSGVASVGNTNTSTPGAETANSPTFNLNCAVGNVALGFFGHGSALSGVSHTQRGALNNFSTSHAIGCCVFDENAGAGATTPLGATSAVSDGWIGLAIELVAAAGTTIAPQTFVTIGGNVPRFAGQAQITRAHLVDTFRAGTQPTIAEQLLTRPTPGAVVSARAHLLDTFIAGTRPVVLTPQPYTAPGTAIAARAHLLDTFTAGTQPAVATPAPPRPVPVTSASRSSLIDAVTPPATLAPQTFVIMPAPLPQPIGQPAAILMRAHLLDTFSAGTQPAVMSSSLDAQALGRLRGAATAARAHLLDLFSAGTQPVVLTPAPYTAAGVVAASRSSLVDVVISTTLAPNLFVIAGAVRTIGGNVTASRSSLVDVAAPGALAPALFVTTPGPTPALFARPPAVFARAHLLDTFTAGTRPTVLTVYKRITPDGVILVARAPLPPPAFILDPYPESGTFIALEHARFIVVTDVANLIVAEHQTITPDPFEHANVVGVVEHATITRR